MSEFSNRFRLLKEECGLTLKDLSDELGVSVPNLSYYMKGREPSYDILINIADYFDVTTDWLIGRTNARTETQESLYSQVEATLNPDTKLSNESKAYYLKCQNTLYKSMTALYTLFLFYGYDSSLSEYLSGQFNMYAGIMCNCINYFNKMYVYTTKDNLLNLIKYGEACSNAQERLLLSTFYNYAKTISEDEEYISSSDKKIIDEVLNFLFENFNEKYPEAEIVELYNKINSFKLDTSTYRED